MLCHSEKTLIFSPFLPSHMKKTLNILPAKKCAYTVPRIKTEEDSNRAVWLKRKENVYTRPEIQNEIIKDMGLQVLRYISAYLQGSPFLTVMADETTDSSNLEKITLILCQVTQELELHEQFLGLYRYYVASIDAAMLKTAIKDVLIRMNLPFEKLCGQCCDGASAMSSSKREVTKRISDLEPQAVYIYTAMAMI